MPTSVTHAQPPLEFIPPRFEPWVYQVSSLLLPAWMRWRVQLVDVQVNHLDVLVELYQQFQAGKIRFMMAFRHPSTNDPYSMYYMVSHCLPQVARQRGIKLKPPVHAHFIYDRGIPLWAGEIMGWFFSHLGGTPIRRGKLDVVGLRSARQLFTDGRFPMAAAPEGATNGHNEVISPIEPGVAQLGFWCIEDLVKTGRSEQVLIVPIGIQYYYTSADWQTLGKFLSEMEADAGLSSEGALEGGSENFPLTPPLTDEQQLVLYKRLIRLGEHLLTVMEEFYTRFYHHNPRMDLSQEGLSPDFSPPNQPDQPDHLTLNRQLAQRLQALLNTALMVSEQYFGIQPKGSLNDRCRRLEQAGWDWIYREDLKQFDGLSPVERGLADRIAEEADLRLWHMRLVESFVSVTGQYIIEKPTIERFADTLLLLWDIVTRIKGKNPFPRPVLGAQRVEMTIGEPISVSDRWDSYKVNRRQAVTQLTQDLQLALTKMLK